MANIQPVLHFDGGKDFRNRFMKKVYNYSDSRDEYMNIHERQLNKSSYLLTEDKYDRYALYQNYEHNNKSSFKMNSSKIPIMEEQCSNNFLNGYVKNRSIHSWRDDDVYNGQKTRVSSGSLTLGPHVDHSVTNEKDIYTMSDLYNDRPNRPDMTQTVLYQQESRSSLSNQVTQGYANMTQYDVKMANEEEVAMNLSTEGKHSNELGTSLSNSPSSVANGDIDAHSQGPTSPHIDIKGTLNSSSSKRKSRPSDEPSLDILESLNQQQSLLMLAAQHGLSPQQLQQMLLSQQGSVMPPHVQQLLQAQQSVVMQQQQKVQEQALVQLNEQLQLNLLQQSQLVQEKKSNGKQTQQQLQQLGLQQQQIVQQIQQIQLQQRQLLLACLMQPYSAQQGVLSTADLHQAWKDMTGTQGTNDDPLKSMVTNGTSLGALNGSSLGMNHLLQGSLLGANGMSPDSFSGTLIGQPPVALKSEDGLNPLYRHGVCKWPGCDTECNDVNSFTKHLLSEHKLDDKNTAQARVQMQIVSQLEIQLTREKELLHAMMQHLHTQPQRKNQELTDHKVSEKKITSPKVSSSMVSPVKSSSGSTNSLPIPPPKKHSSLSHMNPVSSGLTPLVIPPHSSINPIPSGPGTLQSQSQPTTPTGGLGPMRRRVSDKCNLPISAEIQRNRDFYKSTDVRPPFTYASLIRQAIIESENKQLTLNEVYQWFQNTFAYFRRNEATWKNAVRHNLSLHKCFMRVENVKGAVWTVDEVEFYKRRPQKLTGAISNSPSYPSETGIYGDPINASIRAAMEQNPLLFSQQISNGGLSDNGVEDLSMKSYNNSNDSFIKSESPQRDGDRYSDMESMNYRGESLSDSPRDFSNQGLDLSPKASQHGSPKGLFPNSVGSNRSSPQTRNITSESEAPSCQFPSEDGGVKHQEHYSHARDFSIKQEHPDMQVSSPDEDQSEALNMKVEPNGEIDRKDDDDRMEVRKIYSNDRENDSYASYSSSSEILMYQQESPIDQRHSDQNVHASYHHNNPMVSVSHSMT
ncbi:Forkhead box protein P4 [Mactra antiquata]